MKNIKILFFTLLIALTLNNVNANVDQTNAFGFTYNCSGWVWTLHTTFSLGWHHLYNRDYHINKPWIIQIADWNHTTVSKYSNISIDWCWYEANTCNPSYWWNWSIVREEDYLTLNIDSWNLAITKSWSIYTIDWSWSSDDISIVWLDSWDIISNNKKIKLFVNDDSLVIKEYWYDWDWNYSSGILSQTDFTNNTYNWHKEFIYEVSSDYKTIKIKKNIFKRIWTNTVKSSDNTYDVFEAYSWNNTCPWYNDCGLSSDSNYNSWYYTWLNYWDYTQHNYTTTKIKLYPVDLTCTKTEYSDRNSDISTSTYGWTLGWITNPVFWWHLNINNVNSWNFWTTIFATDKLNILWLKYKIVWKVWWVDLWVSKIKVTLKENDITLWKVDYNLSSTKNTTWEFEHINNLEIKDSDWNIITKRSWNYQLVFSFFNGTQQIWTYEEPLLIIPNNDFITSWNIIPWNNKIFANNRDSLNICQNITDSYWNTLSKNYWILNKNKVNITDWIYLNQITNIWKAISVKNVTFNNSQICFDITSKAPWNKFISFTLKIPQHNENDNQTLKWTNKIFSNIETLNKIEFKKPVTWKIQVQTSNWNWNWRPKIWKEQKYKIWLTNIWNLANYSNWKLNFSESDVSNMVDWHFWKSFWWIQNNFGSNLDNYLWFSWSIDANNNILSAVKLWLDNLIISYNLWWKNIKYALNNFWINWYDVSTLWLKVIWNLKWDWKSNITWQNNNFSDLSKWKLRWIIRKNWFKLIRWLSSWEVVNWVKYIDWENIVIWWDDLWFETLIVKNWNVIINWDLNSSNKKLWIIVLKDNYLINSDYNKKWNIYINKNVLLINAIIYADWALRSADSNWNSYIDSKLWNKLIFNWSLFTRNTIWWAVKANSKYLLPWWKWTTDFDLAQIYDLNYIRKRDIIQNSDDDYSFLIKYNPSLQLNPPKWFDSN